MKNLFLISMFFFINVVSIAQNKNEQLFKAVSENNLQQTEKLLKQNADANFVVTKGWVKVSLLITAVNNENVELVKKTH